MAAGTGGKGGNKGKPVKYSGKPAIMSMGSAFSHDKPLQPPDKHGTPIPLREKHRR